MSLIVSTVLPFFLIVGLGAFAGWRGMIPGAAVPALNTFVFRFAIPAVTIRLLWSSPIGEILDPVFLGGWLVTGLVMFAAGALLVGPGPGPSLGRLAIRAQSSAVANIGFLGFPVLLGLFGDAAAGALAMTLIVDLMVMIPITLAILEGARGEARPPHVIAGRALVGSVRNPFFVSIGCGVVLSASGLPIPDPVNAFLVFLGGAAGPTALFALGVYLSINPRIERPGEAARVTLLKLVLHPLVAWLVLGQIFGISGTLLLAATLIAALPSASNVFVIAEQYGVAVKLASDAVLISTVAAVFTLSVAVLILV